MLENRLPVKAFLVIHNYLSTAILPILHQTCIKRKGRFGLKVLDTIDQDYKLEKVVFGCAVIFRLVMRTATALKQPEQYQVGYLLPANI